LKQRLLSETPSLQQRLGDTRSTSGHAFYTHHVSRRQWIGLEYNVQKLISRSAQSDTVAHSAFFTHIISLTPKTRFTVFAGPEHSATYYRFGIPAPAAQVAASRSTWRWAGGATYEWTGTHTSFSASLSRRISDGAGFFGAVRLSGATAELRHELTRRWRADLLISYQLNRPLLGSQGALTYISASGGLTRALSHNVSLDLRYWRVNQSASRALTGIGLSNHHRVSASLAYAFARPLGS
jgi:hypothetical protein